jgi:predicted metal-dependent HD superfamily phosphohydrolase
MRHLAEAWLRDCAAVGARGDVAGTGAELLARYAEPHRGYHDLAHLDEVLRNVDLLGAAADDTAVVRLAAWFHDAVYDPTAPDNEEASARLAAHVLAELRVPDHVAGRVSDLVRLTAEHEPGDDRDGAVLCDADLAILASDGPRYTTYADGVRTEYKHLDDAAFAAGRARVLRSLLDRPSLFRTGFGRTTWEAPARDNLRAELSRLEPL